MESDIGDRLRIIADEKFLGKVKSFSDKVKLPYTTLNEFFIKKKTNPSLDTLKTILKAVPDLNPLWLFLGQGEPFLKRDLHSLEAGNFGEKIPFRNKSLDQLQFANVKDEVAKCHSYTIPLLSQGDFLERAHVDDMAPMILAGDIVSVRVCSADEPWQFGKTYLLETKIGNLLKRVMPGLDNRLDLVSANPNYPIMKIESNQIIGRGIVTGVMGRR